MRYPALVGASALACGAIVATPAYVMSQTATEEVEHKAEHVWAKARSAGRDAQIQMNDTWLTAKTKIVLFADERVKGREIGVETRHGQVTLRGTVDSDEAKAAAASVAGNIVGVRTVRNDLQVLAPGDRKTVDVSDGDITRQVQDRLSRDAHFTKVAVRTDGGVVGLTGEVPGIADSARASELARGAAGARSVKNELVYGSPTGRTAHVKGVQQALKDRGFDPGAIDGVMGLRTASALKDYQKSENLTATGRMDPDTAAKLGAKAGGR